MSDPVPHQTLGVTSSAHRETAPGVTVVFVGGYARIGSTLLDRLLGTIDGFASLGETRHIWERSFRGDQLCGCGRPFRACQFWAEVAGEAFGGFDGVDAAAVDAVKRSVDSFWNIPRIVAGGWPRGYRQRLDLYRGYLRTLYVAIGKVTGARYLVDSTKDPQHAYVLAGVEGLDVRMVHLVRDSRAVAYSWRARAKRRPEIHWGDQDMPRFPVTRSALAWDLANVAAEAIRRARPGRPGRGRRGRVPYAFLRYEDLIVDPEGEITRVLEEIGVPPVKLGFLGNGTARLEPSHTVAGNPVRFQHGRVQLVPDMEWQRRMRPGERRVVTALTWPLLIRYGYAGRGPLAGDPDESVRASRMLRPTGRGPRIREMARTLRLAVRYQREPLPYHRAIAALTLRYLRAAGVAVEGRRILEAGAGNGTLAEALEGAGGRVVALDVRDVRLDEAEETPFVQGDAQRLPFRNAAFDLVCSSNVLEHVPDARAMIAELIRVARPDGVIYLSWTNWFSPVGGHEWSPFHYLGPGLGIRAYRALRRRDPPWNIPGRTLFPVHVGATRRHLAHHDVQVLEVVPRYWPSLRFVARIPLAREVLLWNCVVLMRKVAPPGQRSPGRPSSMPPRGDPPSGSSR